MKFFLWFLDVIYNLQEILLTFYGKTFLYISLEKSRTDYFCVLFKFRRVHRSSDARYSFKLHKPLELTTVH